MSVDETMNDIQYPREGGADLVSVVRCKDCIAYNTHDHRCKHWNHGVVVMDYCSRGERRDG